MTNHEDRINDALLEAKEPLGKLVKELLWEAYKEGFSAGWKSARNTDPENDGTANNQLAESYNASDTFHGRLDP